MPYYESSSKNPPGYVCRWRPTYWGGRHGGGVGEGDLFQSRTWARNLWGSEDFLSKYWLSVSWVKLCSLYCTSCSLRSSCVSSSALPCWISLALVDAQLPGLCYPEGLGWGSHVPAQRVPVFGKYIPSDEGKKLLHPWLLNYCTMDNIVVLVRK